MLLSFICDACGCTEIITKEGYYVCVNCGLCVDDIVTVPDTGIMKHSEPFPIQGIDLEKWKDKKREDE